MKARELAENVWFKWPPDRRILQRLPGPVELIEGKEGIPVKPLQPTGVMTGFYIPADDEVVLFKEQSIRLM